MIIFPHMPKAAGQTILEHLVKIFGDESIAVDYTGTPIQYSKARIPVNRNLKRSVKKWMASSKVLSPILSAIRDSRARNLSLEDVAELPNQGIKVLYGHFPFEKYIHTFKDAETAILLKDPWERCVSHYLYWRREYDNIKDFLPKWFNPDTAFSYFIEQDEIVNLQSKYLEGVELRDVTLLGTSDDVKGFVERLYERYVGEIPPIEDIRINVRTNGLDIPDEELSAIKQRFEQLNAQDISLYREAKYILGEGRVEIRAELRSDLYV